MLVLALNRRAATVTRLVGLGAVIWTILTSDHAPGLHGRGLVVLVTLVLASVTWLADIVRRVTNRLPEIGIDEPVRPEMAILGLAGGILTGACPSSAAAVFPFIGAASSALRTEPPATFVVTGFALAGVAGSTLAYSGHGHGIGILGYGLGLIAVTFAASGARQRNARIEQSELLLAQTQRSHEEQLRSARLEESARIAREIHDVLAHSLAGLTIQLEATAALLEQDADRETVAARIRRAHGLALEGLRETRRAVGALRAEPQLGLRERMEALVAERRAAGGETELDLLGEPDRLDADTATAIVRTVQEGLTNAAKHAPGAAVTVSVDVRDGVRVSVEDRGPGARDRTAPGQPLAGSGGGYGLRGMRERAEALGGALTVGPTEAGWRVELRLPERAAPPPERTADPAIGSGR